MFKNIFRISEWGNTHLIVIVSCYYLFSGVSNISWSAFLNHLFFLFFITLTLGSFGFYLNDVYDVEQDQLVEKKNFALNHSISVRLVLLTSLLSSAFIIWYILSGSKPILFVIIVESLLLFCYSVPFIRLKEKRVFNVMTDALYAFVLPGIVIVFLTIHTVHILSLQTYLFLSWLFIMGLRSILNHHIEDWKNDKISKTKTAVFYIGLSKVQFIVKLILPPIEFIFLCSFLWLINWVLLLSYLAFVVYVVLREAFVIRYLQAGMIKPILNISNSIFNEFYVKWLPLLAFLVLIEQSWKYLFVYLIHLIIFFSVTKNFKYDFKFIYNKLIKIFYYHILRFIYFKIRNILSIIVNYSLYYIFLIVGINLKERAAKKTETLKVNPATLNESKQGLNFVNKLEIENQLKEKSVHSLFEGTELTDIEHLTIKSFIDNGYLFHLWIYQDIVNPFPNQLILCDANEILNESMMEKRNSIDLFKYRLLFEHGGWWTDLDITCLKPFDVKKDYFFSANSSNSEIGSLMKVKKGSDLMKKCYEDEITRINQGTKYSMYPISALTNNIYRLNLEEHISSSFSCMNQVGIENYFFKPNQLPNETYFIKWYEKSIFSAMGIKKSFYNSFFSELLIKYDLRNSLELDEQKRDDRKVRLDLVIFNLKNIL